MPDGPQPPGRGQQPEPTPALPAPEEFAHMYMERAGFFNDYFNKLHRQRILSALRGLGDFHGLTGLWMISGHTQDGRAFQFKLTADAAAVKIGEAVSIQPLSQDFEDLPVGTGGLLTALHAMKMMLADSAGYFSEIYYVGQEPLDGRGPLVDVLWTTRGQMFGRWYFDADNARWLGFDTGVAEDVDECEIRIDGLQTFEGRSLPERLTVRHGDATVATFLIEHVDFP